jgi:hypothetical protein
MDNADDLDGRAYAVEAAAGGFRVTEDVVDVGGQAMTVVQVAGMDDGERARALANGATAEQVADFAVCRLDDGRLVAVPVSYLVSPETMEWDPERAAE